VPASPLEMVRKMFERPRLVPLPGMLDQGSDLLLLISDFVSKWKGWQF
jgi:hypothetical protein